MAIPKEAILKYLSGQGFRFAPNGDARHFLLTENGLHYGFDWINVRRSGGVIIIEPEKEKEMKGTYSWKPNLRQLVSRLEVTTIHDGSLAIQSPKEIYLGEDSPSPSRAFFCYGKGYSHFLLSTTRKESDKSKDFEQGLGR